MAAPAFTHLQSRSWDGSSNPREASPHFLHNRLRIKMWFLLVHLHVCNCNLFFHPPPPWDKFYDYKIEKWLCVMPTDSSLPFLCRHRSVRAINPIFELKRRKIDSWQNNNLFEFRQKEIHICALCGLMNSFVYIHFIHRFIDIYIYNLLLQVAELNYHHHYWIIMNIKDPFPPSPPPTLFATHLIFVEKKSFFFVCFQKHSFRDASWQNSSRYISLSQDSHRRHELHQRFHVCRNSGTNQTRDREGNHKPHQPELT